MNELRLLIESAFLVAWFPNSPRAELHHKDMDLASWMGAGGKAKTFLDMEPRAGSMYDAVF